MRKINMISQQPSVSIVIPVYNEEAHLVACLDAIAQQTVSPLEVVIVDNNCTDDTIPIARRYSFVRIVRESRQGLVYARNRGFNAAGGDVIGRIDTDTQLSPDWVERVQRLFTDSGIDAVSGGIGFYDVPFPALFGRIDGFFRRYLARNLARRQELFLYGSNMAVRRKTWDEIRNTLCKNQDFHEDIDMAAHLAHTSCIVYFDAALQVNVSARRIDSSWRSYYPYVMANSRTYAAHNLKGRYYMYPIEWLTLLFYLPLRLLYRSYDPETHAFSFRQLIRGHGYSQRVSPISREL